MATLGLDRELASLLRSFEPIFLPHPSSGRLRVLEKSSRIVCDVTDGSLDREEIAFRLQSLLVESVSRSEPALRGTVHVLYEAFVHEETSQALAKLATFLNLSAPLQIVVHLGEYSADWRRLKLRLSELRDRIAQSNELPIQIVGSFAESIETEMDWLFALGVRVRFAAGWRTGLARNEVLPVSVDALRSFSEYGFRTIIEWYIHDGNMAAFEEQIPHLLSVNHCSGFSLPLISESPYYHFNTDSPALPDALDYCTFLARNYHRYPYYDEILAPLNALALLIKGGGWHSQIRIPAMFQMIVDAEGRVGLYRHAPALAESWTTVSRVLTSPLTVLREEFLGLAHEIWDLEQILYCHDCRWRFICGGLDRRAETALDKRAMDAMCGFRKLFLKHFATLRTSDFVIGESANGNPKI